MLLEFRTKNYKSFTDELVFSLTPVQGLQELEYSILSASAGEKQYHGLSTAVIYGPNAAGKSNIIGAMESLKEIVLRGNINNINVKSYNTAASNLELIPNSKSEASPTSFYIRFIDNDLMVEYTLSAELGPFLDKNFNRKIIEEKLCVNGELVFLRNDHVILNHTLSIASAKPLTDLDEDRFAFLQEVASKGLADTTLFLSSGLKFALLQELEKRILDWFNYRLIVIYQSDDIVAVQKHLGASENTIYVEKTLTEAAREFGITANILGYKINNQEDRSPELYSLIVDEKTGNVEKCIPASSFESYGTIRFVNHFPLIIYALLHGATLVLDEFDANIHPMALMSIVNAFHNDDININCAQLIFNTHNPIFLDSSVFRKDEIKFVDRDENEHSIQYALSDFEAEEEDHWKEDYLNNYFVGKYGALKDVDFSSILEKIITGAKER